MVMEHPLCQALRVQQTARHSPVPRVFTSRLGDRLIQYSMLWHVLQWGQARGAWQSTEGLQISPAQPGESYQTLEKAEGTAGANKELQDAKDWSGGKKGEMNLREGSDDDGPLPHPFLLII